MIMKKSTQVAMGGLASALCLVLMFMTGLIPFATYALPAAAGVVLIAIVVENGPQTALLVYLSVALLSLFVVPDREAALTFIGFFGYYPILRLWLDRILVKPVRVCCKFAVFNGATLLAYWVAIQLFGMAYLMEDLNEFGMIALAILLLMGNVMFVLYDNAVSSLYIAYVRIFRPKLLKGMGKF